MSDIKASDVKALRERTGAGMMDCKKALVDAGGDFEEAKKILRKKGLAAAARKAERAASEGLVVARVTPKAAVLTQQGDLVLLTNETMSSALLLVFLSPGCGPCGIPDGWRVTEPTSIPLREEKLPST